MAAAGSTAATVYMSCSVTELISGQSAAAAAVYIKTVGTVQITAEAQPGAIVCPETVVNGQISGAAATGADCWLIIDSFEMVTSGALIDSVEAVQEESDEP